MSPSKRVVKSARQLERERRMQDAMSALVAYFGPNVGIMLFTFDAGAKGFLSYKANVPRQDGLDVLKTWQEENG